MSFPDKQTYKDGIDFAKLAHDDPEFAHFIKANGQLDFTNPEAVQQLTKSLLKRDFHLCIELPDDRLCPPVPNRLNYIIWIQDLIDTTSDRYLDRYDPKKLAVGLDVGTGASAIYPLLGCRLRPMWRFWATDIDEKSLLFARQNVELNELTKSITLHSRTATSLLLDVPADAKLDFSMCNPPFYESTAEMIKSAESKHRKPFSACTGSETEMVTPGGEVAFVKRMIDESLVLKERILWYTSLLGKLSSLSVIIEELRTKEIDNYAVTEFIQGSKTRRWGIAWSFGDLRSRNDVARGLHSIPKSLLPFPTEYGFSISATVSSVGMQMDHIFDDLDLMWRWKQNVSTGVGRASKDVWSRAARRRKDMVEPDESHVAIAFKVQLAESQDLAGTEVHVRWLQGRSSVLFESFCGMLKRKMQ